MLGELVAVLVALLVIALLLGLGVVMLVAGAYAKGAVVLAFFAIACVLFFWTAKRLDHWVKPPPPPVHGLVSAKHAPLILAVICLCMGAWPLYLVAHGLADGEMWTLNSRAHNSLVSADKNPVAYWLTVAKGSYLGLCMLYGAFWFVHHRRRIIRASLAGARHGHD